MFVSPLYSNANTSCVLIELEFIIHSSSWALIALICDQLINMHILSLFYWGIVLSYSTCISSNLAAQPGRLIQEHCLSNYGQLGPKTIRPRTTRPRKMSAQDNSAQVVPISEDNSAKIAPDIISTDHHENTPIQIYWTLYHQKKKKEKIIRKKNLIFFSYFCSIHILWVLVRIASTRQI